MGVPKPLLEWGGYTLIEYRLAQLKGPPIDRVVVLGHRAEEVQPYACSAGAQAIVNELYGEGRAVIQRHGKDIRELAFETEVVLLDLNQPQEYQKARASYFG